MIGGLHVDIQNLFGIYSNPGLELVRILDYYNVPINDTPAKATRLSNTYRAFCFCKSLRKWLGYYNISNDSYASHFYDAIWPELEELWLVGIKKNTGAFKYSNKIKYECLRFMVDNAANTSPITVTVHADIYKTLTGESTSDLNGGTAAEWQKLLADAVARNISPATN